MRFSLFVHMERLDRDTPDRALYEEFVELALMAEAGGMHSVWTGEHHAMAFTIAPNPFLLLVDLGHRTRRIRLGTSTLVAPFWHPIRLAGEAALADLILEGRLELGLARGAYVFEYERLAPGIDAWKAGQYLRELVPALKGLWQGDYVHDGTIWRFPSTTALPKPIQKPHPPLWIAARDPNTHEFAVAQGCGVQCTPLHKGPQEVENLMGKFRAACEKLSDLPRPPIMVLEHTYVAASAADAAAAAEAISLYYATFAAWFRNDHAVRQGQIDPPDAVERAAHLEYAPEAIRRKCVIGEATEVIERLKQYEKLGFDEFALWIDSGMSRDAKRESLARFLDAVLPAFASSAVA